ncbi:MAG: hypothetical protein PHY34_00095 [Patescibacteria group bacterium]|nr:hypothetical protein [Patescibacteria group bacterium]MDD5715968.1 hypothetical protein [Patescibacteria group bacterium]
MASQRYAPSRLRERQRGLAIIRQVIASQNFRTDKKIKFGDRYYIAEGSLRSTPALFKSCIFPPSFDHLTHQKFSREIIFLTFVKRSHFNALKRAVPYVYASSVSHRAWYIREYFGGIRQNIHDGNIRFRPSFFTPASLRWVLNTFFELQSIREQDLPDRFKKLLYAPQTFAYLWRFVRPFRQHVDAFTRIPNASQRAFAVLRAHNTLAARFPRVLAHQEPYAPHILKTGASYRLIDWENIGWASIMKDFVTIWMRASSNPAWQRALYHRLKRRYGSYAGFNNLWSSTVLLQSVFNTIGYHFYPDKKDFAELGKFSAQKIREILANNFRMYN